MKKYQLNFPPAVETQTILETGRGRTLQITLSHSLEAAQTTTFYDREGVQLANISSTHRAARTRSPSATGTPFLSRTG